MALFDFAEGIAKDSRLLFDVEEREGRVRFEHLQTFVYGLEE